MIEHASKWLVDLAYSIAERLPAAGYRVNLVIDPMEGES